MKVVRSFLGLLSFRTSLLGYGIVVVLPLLLLAPLFLLSILNAILTAIMAIAIVVAVAAIIVMLITTVTKIFMIFIMCVMVRADGENDCWYSHGCQSYRILPIVVAITTNIKLLL